MAMQGISELALSTMSWVFSKVSGILGGAVGEVTKDGLSAIVSLRTTSNDIAVASLAVEPHSKKAPILYIQATRYKQEVKSDQIKQLLRSLQETLSSIPQIKSIRVGEIIDTDRLYDYVVVMEFDSINDLKSYGNTDIHKKWVREHDPVSLTASDSTLTFRMYANI
jgi:hypothetical protein